MSEYRIVLTFHFKKDIKVAKRRGYDMRLIEKVVDTLAAGEELEAKYKDHKMCIRDSRDAPDEVLRDIIAQTLHMERETKRKPVQTG